MIAATDKHEPGPPREPEVPVIDDPPDPGLPQAPEMPPPVPDPPEVVGIGYGSEEAYYYADGWTPASWRPHSPTQFDGEGTGR